jgi:cytochrome c2
MPALLVLNGSPSSAIASRETAPGNTLNAKDQTRLLGGTALIAFAAGIILIVFGKKKRSTFLAGVILIGLCGGLAVASYTSVNAELQPVSPVTFTSSNESTGQQLFLAKGCVVCHINDRAIKGSEQYSVSMGPNLSAYQNDPDYLHTFLKDPRSAKTTTDMPNLELKREEIDALVEFINNHE